MTRPSLPLYNLGILPSFLPLSPDYQDDHHARLLDLIAAGLAPGTWRNKNLQARTYIQYMRRHQVAPLAPTQYDVLSYVLHLSETLATPGAALNYLSGARTLLRTFGAATTAFDTYPVALAKRGVQRASTHQAGRAPPLTPTDIKNIVSYLQSAGPNARVLTASLLIAYFTLMRQSNLLASSPYASGSHALRACDVTITPAGLNIQLASTKTRWRSGPPTNIAVPAIPGSPCCPVQAWLSYASQGNLHLQGPAFVTISGEPLRASALTAAIKLALRVAGHPSPDVFTLHSLRRGGAQACALAGSTLPEIKELGTWSSDSVYTYVPRDSVVSAPRTLSSIFG